MSLQSQARRDILGR